MKERTFFDYDSYFVYLLSQPGVVSKLLLSLFRQKWSMFWLMVQEGGDMHRSCPTTDCSLQIVYLPLRWFIFQLESYFLFHMMISQSLWRSVIFKRSYFRYLISTFDDLNGNAKLLTFQNIMSLSSSSVSPHLSPNRSCT